MERLSKKMLSQISDTQNLTIGPLDDYPIRAIQFGEGNFLRTFMDWMLDELNRKGLWNGKVIVVQPIEEGRIAEINEQDGLYTAVLRGIEQGEIVDKRHLITAIQRGINPYQDWWAVLECARNPDLQFLFSNTTEMGIAYQQESFRTDQCPRSFPGKVTAFLHERYQYFQGDVSKGVIVIPCELIEQNGDILRSIIIQLSEEWGFEDDFRVWIEHGCYFVNTLVDRIVPGYPHDDAPTLFQELGYQDTLLTMGEVFYLWVIEGPQHLAEEIPFYEAGLNVIWTNDLSAYRNRKIRVLNGSHTASVLAAYIAGLNTVREMMEEELFSKYLRAVIFEEILPVLPIDEREKKPYAESVLERFRNPFIHHELLTISVHSIQKWKVRILPSILEYIRIKQRIPPLLSSSLAVLLFFYRSARTTKDGSLGQRGGEEYPIQDEMDSIQFINTQWETYKKDNDVSTLVKNIISNEELWGQDLTLIDGLYDAVSRSLEDIIKKGMRNAIDKWLI